MYSLYMHFGEIKDIICNSYKLTHDLKLAYKKLNLTEGEIAQCEADELLQSRINIIDVELKEKLFKTLWELVETQNNSSRIKAVELLGRMIYPEFFEFNDNKKVETVGSFKIMFNGPKELDD